MAKQKYARIKEWFASSGVDWEKQLPAIVYFLNSTVIYSPKVSPFQLLFGRHPSFPNALARGLVCRRTFAPRIITLFLYETVLSVSTRWPWIILRLLRGSIVYKERYNASNCPSLWQPFVVVDSVKYECIRTVIRTVLTGIFSMCSLLSREEE